MSRAGKAKSPPFSPKVLMCPGLVLDNTGAGASKRPVESYLVDPASSHMLVSKIKPCMSKFTLFHGETANGSLNQSRFLR